jgi:hypothetical protein
MKLGIYTLFAALLSPTIALLTALVITLGTGEQDSSALRPSQSSPSSQVQQG